MFARLYAEHNITVSEDGRNGVHYKAPELGKGHDIKEDTMHTSSRQRFAKEYDVRSNIVMLKAQHLARSTETSLDLVAYEKHIVFLA